MPDSGAVNSPIRRRPKAKWLFALLYGLLIMGVALLLLLSGRWQRLTADEIRAGQLLQWQQQAWVTVESGLRRQNQMLLACASAHQRPVSECIDELSHWFQQSDALAYRLVGDEAHPMLIAVGETRQWTKSDAATLWWSSRSLAAKSQGQMNWILQTPLKRPLLELYLPLPGNVPAGVWLLLDVSSWLRTFDDAGLTVAWISPAGSYFPGKSVTEAQLSQVQWQNLLTAHVQERTQYSELAVRNASLGLGLLMQAPPLPGVIGWQTLVLIALGVLAVVGPLIAFRMTCRSRLHYGVPAPEPQGEVVIDCLEQGVLLLDAQGLVQMHNESARQLLRQELAGYSFETILSTLMSDDAKERHSLGWRDYVGGDFELTLGGRQLSFRLIAMDQDDELHVLVLVGGGYSPAQIREILKEKDLLLEQFKAELEKLRSVDEATGIHSRYYLDRMLPHEIERCRRSHQDLTAILVAVDEPEAGLLAAESWRELHLALARLLKVTVGRGTDVVAQYSPSAYCLLLPNTPPDFALQLAGRVQELIDALLRSPAYVSAEITFSIGVYSQIPDTHSSAVAFRQHLEAALSKARFAGSNQIQFLFEEQA